MATTKMLGYLNFSQAIENYIWIAWRAIVQKYLTHRLVLCVFQYGGMKQLQPPAPNNKDKIKAWIKQQGNAKQQPLS